MIKDLKKKGISIKDEPGVSVVRLFGPGVGDEKVIKACPYVVLPTFGLGLGLGFEP